MLLSPFDTENSEASNLPQTTHFISNRAGFEPRQHESKTAHTSLPFLSIKPLKPYKRFCREYLPALLLGLTHIV